MKTNKLFLMAAFVCGAAFTSCSNEDNAGSQAYTVSFCPRFVPAGLHCQLLPAVCACRLALSAYLRGL